MSNDSTLHDGQLKAESIPKLALREAASTRPDDRVVPKLLMNYDEASWSLGVCERTLRNMVTDGRLVAVKIGGRTLFDVEDLRAVVRANRKVQG